MSKEEKFREILKKYGVTKCSLSSEFSFEDKYPDGDITLNVKDKGLIKEVFMLFTPDGILADNQFLGVWYSQFKTDKLKPNFKI